MSRTRGIVNNNNHFTEVKGQNREWSVEYNNHTTERAGQTRRMQNYSQVEPSRTNKKTVTYNNINVTVNREYVLYQLTMDFIYLNCYIQFNWI